MKSYNYALQSILSPVSIIILISIFLISLGNGIMLMKSVFPDRVQQDAEKTRHHPGGMTRCWSCTSLKL